jgi:precorrin-3B C17-methyltransferase
MLSIVGFGCGSYENMTIEAKNALENADLIVGFSTYVKLLMPYFKEKEFFSTEMMQEKQRCAYAIEQAESGREVALICSGDSGVYGMASLVYELAGGRKIEIKVVSGVTAANSGAALLGAPLSHDFAVISLSDRMTPWELIEKRLKFAACSDMVICLYNPSSRKRADYLQKACDILLEDKSEDTVCGYVKNIGRAGEEAHVLSLRQLRDTAVDMFTTVYIGNKATKEIDGKMVTPRGYSV